MSGKRKSDEISSKNDESSGCFYACSKCQLFCAGRTSYSLFTYYSWLEVNPSHAMSDDSERERLNLNSLTKVGLRKDECTEEQRVALLCSLYKIASETSNKHDLALLHEPKFLKANFKPLLCPDKDQEKVIRVAVLYSCNKVLPECHVLALGKTVKDIAAAVGPLQEYMFEDDDGFVMTYPFAVANIVNTVDEGCHHHYVLTSKQWKKLRNDVGCSSERCGLYMSVLTFKNKESIDIDKDILTKMEIL